MTLFKPELAQAIAEGNKTQTRRPKKSGDILHTAPDGIKTVYTGAGKIKMQTGRNYAIQYAYGLPCRWWNPAKKELLEYDHYLNALEGITKVEPHNILREINYEPFRYEITDIREEDVRNISHADALAEGFGHGYETAAKYEFLRTWMMFYDDTFAYKMLETEYDSYLPNHCPLWLWNRPDEKYQALAYTFKIYLPEAIHK